MASNNEKTGAVGKTLYVTDLDGTLMRNDETLSAYTIETINNLIAKGLATGIIGCNGGRRRTA